LKKEQAFGCYVLSVLVRRDGNMKTIQSLLQAIFGLVIVAALVVVLVVAFRSVSGETGIAPAAAQLSPAATTQLEAGYPAPDQTVSGYPAPGATPVPGVTVLPAITLAVLPKNPTPWLTFTPPVQPTVRPGPSETPLPLVQPASDASGSIIYLTSSKPAASVADLGASLAFYSISVDKSGNPTGSPISLTGNRELNLAWNGLFPAPDGSRVAVTGDWGAVTILNTETGQVEPLLKTGYGGLGGFMGWHPDSRRIVYAADAGPDSGIWLVGASDYTLVYRDLTGFPAIGRSSAISPDGRKLVYSFYRGAGDTAELRMINVDGSDPKLLLTSSRMHFYNILWSPDGRKLMFLGEQGLTIMDVADEIVSPLPMKGILGYFTFEFVWSPDSRTIAYVSSPDLQKGSQPDSPPFLKASIRLIDVTTGADHPLLDEVGNADPAWSPDGSQIAFVSVHSGSPEIWAANVDGTHLRAITSGNQYARFPVWRR
jgi:dipeptidyl aminopeptidase/acylaminoacyl peptidase